MQFNYNHPSETITITGLDKIVGRWAVVNPVLVNKFGQLAIIVRFEPRRITKAVYANPNGWENFKSIDSLSNALKFLRDYCEPADEGTTPVPVHKETMSLLKACHGKFYVGKTKSQYRAQAYTIVPSFIEIPRLKLSIDLKIVIGVRSKFELLFRLTKQHKFVSFDKLQLDYTQLLSRSNPSEIFTTDPIKVDAFKDELVFMVAHAADGVISSGTSGERILLAKDNIAMLYHLLTTSNFQAFEDLIVTHVIRKDNPKIRENVQARIKTIITARDTDLTLP